MANYARVILKGTLTTLSDLHIGTGEKQAITDEKESFNSNALAQDIAGNPYIPASSLRGYLRSLEKDPILQQKIYGIGRQAKDQQDTGNSGAMRIYDARWQTEQDQWQAKYISRTSIDPITGTAKEHHLSTHTLVSAQSHFDLEIQLDHVTEKEVEAVLKALSSLKAGRIGKGKSVGQGQLQWEINPTESKTLLEASLKNWLNNPKLKLAKAYRTLKDSTIEPYSSDWKSIELYLKALSPLVINDPHTVRKVAAQTKASNKANNEDKHPPDLISLQNGNIAIIPASTLKGWMRAHCHKILQTMTKDKSSIEQLLNALFGSTDTGRGCLQFSNATTELTNKDTHTQTFIAIDRFTGGAKPGALFKAQAVFPEEAFQTHIHYHKDKLEDWMKILLLYIARDAIEGDLIIGWGKNKGYGQLQLAKNFHTLKQQYQDQFELWHTALQNKLNSTTQGANT
ncbi:MAG TPA: hypothetical protein EYG68_11765 [Leucothrix mucor]|nr:hypothetical protein [Leucothrix mucor]